MSQSLREQLLEAGLVTEEQAKQAEAPPPRRQGKGRPATGKGRRPPRRGKPPGGGGGNGGRAPVSADPPRKDRGASRNPPDRALKARLRELVATHRENHDEADLPYHFQVGSTIKHVYVTPPQQQALAEGRLCIAFLDGRRHLLPGEVGREILRQDPKRTVVFPAEAAKDPD
ncbi:MAG: DUF2058 family protein [Ectothiorhodospira sp.]